jgi:hypothetical protein
MTFTEERDGEPVWDNVSFYRCDFRPEIQGDLVNLWTSVFPAEDRAASAAQFRHCTIEIAKWLRANQSRFGLHDAFQIVVGWPKSVRQCSRQVVKTGGDWRAVENLAAEMTNIEMRRGWDTGVFP